MKVAVPKNWDKVKGYEMWKKGATDKQIAVACGVSAASVGVHRRKYWTSPRRSNPSDENQRFSPAPLEVDPSTPLRSAQDDNVGGGSGVQEF